MKSASVGPVSRERYERERRARAEAEALLETKAREIFDANKRLIQDSEFVRTALMQTEQMRAREAAAHRELSIVSKSLAALSGKTGADVALQTLLDVLQKEFAVDDACFIQPLGAHVTISAASRPQSVGLNLPIEPGVLTRSRRAASLAAISDEGTVPQFLRDIEAVIIAPIKLGEESIGGLLLCSSQVGFFTLADLRILDRVSQLTSQALLALREARRNALLASIVEGRTLDDHTSILDAPLEAVHRALTRVTVLQSEVVGIIDFLLAAPVLDADEAITAALSRLGFATRTSRLQVMRFDDEAERYECTHEWYDTRVDKVDERFRHPPRITLRSWQNVFEVGDEVSIEDASLLSEAAPERAFLEARGTHSILAVPMLQGGQLKGYIGFEFLNGSHGFLPGERHLLRAVGKVVVSVLARRDAERQLIASHADALAQRARVEAVLSAMPDVILELDTSGRLVACHSDLQLSSDEALVDSEGRHIDEVLPSEFSTEVLGALADLRQEQTAKQRDIRLDRAGTTRWWRLTASLIGDRGYLIVLREQTIERARTAEIELLSEIARRTTNLVVVTDADRRIKWVNSAFEQTTGWQLEEVRGRNAGSFLQSEASDRETIAHIRNHLDAGLAVQAEILNRTRAGRDYWIALDIQPLRHRDGTVYGFMAVETDVTERKTQAEQLKTAANAAAAAQAILVAAVDSLQDGFVLYDASDRLVICNAKYREIYSNSAEAIVPGATFESILRYGLDHGEYAEAVGREEQWLAERLRLHARPYSEIEQQLSNGRWLRIFEKATPNGGRVGLRVDITALKLAEKRALSDRATAMEASQDGIAITDSEGRFTYMNLAHLSMFGFEAESEAIGQSWTLLYAPDAVEWMLGNAMPVLRERGRWSGEIAGLARDGRIVEQDVSLTLKDDGGMLCITRDISQRRREAEERERLRDDLHMAQRREAIGQMAAGLAHDFNNLLAAISGSASLIEQQIEQGTTVAAGIDRIMSATRQAAGLVSRLMALGARPLDRSVVDLRKPVADAVELLRTTIRSPVTLQVSLPDSPAEALADPIDILQVVLNLTINARDAIADQPGRIAIHLRTSTDEDMEGALAVGSIVKGRPYLSLVVLDNGPGMSDEIAAQIFRPWFTTKGQQGTGVGLAVVASVVTNNGGAIKLTTAKGEGTKFIILWPIAAQAAKTSAEEKLQHGMSGRLDGRTILVVDDQQEVLDVIAAMLELAGAEVAPSSDPHDALQAVAEDPHAWDLLITDFDMPGMTGAQLADAVRIHQPDLPVVLVTALAGAANRGGERFNAVIGKPVDRAQLVSCAESVILTTKVKEL